MRTRRLGACVKNRACVVLLQSHGSDQQQQHQQPSASSSSAAVATSTSRSNGLTDHHLSLLPSSEYSFSSVQHCHICNQLFWGLVNNGYQCQGLLPPPRRYGRGGVAKIELKLVYAWGDSDVILSTVVDAAMSEVYCVAAV